MTLRAESIDDLARQLAEANSRRQPIHGYDLSPLHRLVQYTPEDMTVTVQAGCTLASLQEQLAAHHQWLPMDPAHPGQVTVADLIHQNLQGPHRFGCGTVRDHLIGLRVALPDGRVIRSGGRVVKNVAGYDLLKLFVGSLGTLGLVVEATFKLMPIPEVESFHACPTPDIASAAPVIRSVLKSDLSPVVLDLCPSPQEGCRVIVAIAGSAEQVAWQKQQCEPLGFTEPADLTHEQRFWDTTSTLPAQRRSVLPTRLTETLIGLDIPHWIARAGNGLILYRDDRPPPETKLPHLLMDRIKSTFDPNGILPALPW